MTAAGDLRDAADQLERYPADVVRRGVDMLRAAVGARLRVDTGGDQRLSGIGNARLTVSGKVTGSVFVEGRVTAGPRQLIGPWRWLNDGTRPHGNHPGTRPLATFDRPVADTLPVIERDAVRVFDRLELLR